MSQIRTAVSKHEGAIAVLLIATVFSIVQAASPSIIGIDGYYHIRVAALMRELGPRLDFPWLQLTILGPGRYADHHFLFHVLQVPFTFGDTRTGAKMAAILFATLGLYISYLFLARHRVRFAFLWLLVLLAASQTFLWRQSMARPQGLFLALMVLALWMSFQRRPTFLIPIGFAAAWLFDGFPLLMGVPLAALGSVVCIWLLSRLSPTLGEQWKIDGPPALRGAIIGTLAAALGIGLGLVTHPYFPRHFEFAILHLLPKAQVGIELDVPVGAEWYPFSASGLPSRVGPSIACCLLGLIPVAIQVRHRQLPDWRTLTLGAMAFGLVGMTIRSQRIIEYSPAFAVLFCAWSWSRTDLALRWPGLWLRLPNPGRWMLLVACLGVTAGVAWTVAQARRDATRAYGWDVPRGAAEWLVQNTPPGSRVFTPAFDDFPRLFYWDTHNTYLVGLDPTYMALYDQQLYEQWRRVALGRASNPSAIIRDRFQAEYVFTERSRSAFVQAALADPGFETVHSTPRTLDLRVRPAT